MLQNKVGEKQTNSTLEPEVIVIVEEQRAKFFSWRLYSNYNLSKNWVQRCKICYANVVSYNYFHVAMEQCSK